MLRALASSPVKRTGSAFAPHAPPQIGFIEGLAWFHRGCKAASGLAPSKMVSVVQIRFPFKGTKKGYPERRRATHMPMQFKGPSMKQYPFPKYLVRYVTSASVPWIYIYIYIELVEVRCQPLTKRKGGEPGFPGISGYFGVGGGCLHVWFWAMLLCFRQRAESALKVRRRVTMRSRFVDEWLWFRSI